MTTTPESGTPQNSHTANYVATPERGVEEIVKSLPEAVRLFLAEESARQYLEGVEKGKQELQKARQEGYGLAVKHLKEAYSANGTTTVPEAIEWLEDNAKYHSELDQDVSITSEDKKD